MTSKSKKMLPDDNKRCVLLWKPEKYGLTILTMNHASKSEGYKKPIFYIPLKTFMRCGAFWSALNLCTIFWERCPYQIERERSFQQIEETKGAYLIAFAPDMAPICKKWADGCIKKLHQWPRYPETNEVFVEIIIFEESLKNKIMDAIKGNMLQVFERYNNNNNVYKKEIYNVFEKSSNE